MDAFFFGEREIFPNTSYWEIFIIDAKNQFIIASVTLFYLS